MFCQGPKHSILGSDFKKTTKARDKDNPPIS